MSEFREDRFARDMERLEGQLDELTPLWMGLVQVLALDAKLPAEKIGQLAWLRLETAALHMRIGALYERHQVRNDLLDQFDWKTRGERRVGMCEAFRESFGDFSATKGG